MRWEAVRVRSRIVFLLIAAALASCADRSDDTSSADAARARDLPKDVADLICDDVEAAVKAVEYRPLEASQLLPHMRRFLERADELESMGGVDPATLGAVRARLAGASAELGVLGSGGEAPRADSLLAKLVAGCEELAPSG